MAKKKNSGRKRARRAAQRHATTRDRSNLDAATRSRASRASVRPAAVRATQPTRFHSTPEPMSEVSVRRPGSIPVSAVVASREVTPELFRRLENQYREPPRLSVARARRGAIDVRLEDTLGRHVKTGTVVLEGPRRTRVPVALDAVTRRFRRPDLPVGDYRVRAVSAGAGAGSARVVVRERDVTRVALRLDGAPRQGAADVKFAVRGASATHVTVRAADVATGKTVVDKRVRVRNRQIAVAAVPFGRLHWNIGDGAGTTCYDGDVNELTFLGDMPVLELVPIPDPDPTPDPLLAPFAALPPEYAGVVRALPQLGVRSLEQLAATEPEYLMHAAAAAGPRAATPIARQLYANVIDAARATLGLAPIEGEVRTPFRIAAGATYSRAFRPRTPGEIELEVDVGSGNRAELVVSGLGRGRKLAVDGAARLTLNASADDVAAGRALRVAVRSRSRGSTSGFVRSRLPGRALTPGVSTVPTIEALLGQIYQAVAVRNPGLGIGVPSAVMVPEDIEMWMDRAHAMMAAAGVCSLDDLGDLRVHPLPILRPGVYVAPPAPPITLAQVPALERYTFAGVLGDSVLHYRPNDILHETAIVIARGWFIEDEWVVLAPEVRELVVITERIYFSGWTRFFWQPYDLPDALHYHPSPAPNGADAVSPGATGDKGTDGDQDPSPAINGGGNAPTPGPTMTFYVYDTTAGLPPIYLWGQNGGQGGRGQDGGRGGDGQTGLRADGTFFGGCCREAGRGGDGASGGRGGKGGRGGHGGAPGRLTLLTSTESVVALALAAPHVDLTPGSGGPGGPGGQGGKGGQGGAPGTADCEPWCDEHPDRVGMRGKRGAAGETGDPGEPGMPPAMDAFQIKPITRRQWLQELYRPHIFFLDPFEAEPGEEVHVFGENFDPAIDYVFFDGNQRVRVLAPHFASFQVPMSAEGGQHPVVVHPPNDGWRRSNRAYVRIVPRLDPIPAGTRWVEGQTVTLTGQGFGGNVQVLAQDWSEDPHVSYVLPVDSVTTSTIQLTIPPAPLGNLRGVRRIVVRAPDGATSRSERIVRIGHTIVVRCAAFRVVGPSPATPPALNNMQITHLFDEGTPLGVGAPWAQADIVFKLVQPVQTVMLANFMDAWNWPRDLDENVQDARERELFDDHGGVPGALNFFFFWDVEWTTAYCSRRGVMFIGTTDQQAPEREDIFWGPVDMMQILAHEVGHALCLQHACASGGENASQTLFGRECEDGDDANLMYPYWNDSDSTELLQSQIDAARITATHYEQGKTALAHPWDISRCVAGDTTN